VKRVLFVGIGILLVLCIIVAVATGSGSQQARPAAGSALPAATAPAAATPTTAKPANTPTATPEPTLTPTPELGASRMAPLPVGIYGHYKQGEGAAVLGIERNADAKIEGFNMFNEKPVEGQEWVIVRAQYSCNKAESETCTFAAYEFRLVGKKGVIYEHRSVVVPDRYSPNRELFGGSHDVEVYLPYMVDKDDGQFVVIWDPGLGRRAIYFATE
jgi:hypothetical protein